MRETELIISNKRRVEVVEYSHNSNCRRSKLFMMYLLLV